MKEKKRFKKIEISLSIVILILIFLMVLLYFTTGFLSWNKIDERDLDYWNYTKGIISGADAFTMYGSNDTCWLILHGYSSTPKDMLYLAESVYGEFNETIIVPRLRGHSSVPSDLLNLSFSDWYLQVENEFLLLEKSCHNINLVGFSMGGALSLKIAEEYEVNHVYVFSPFLKLRYKWYRIFSLEKYIDVFGDVVLYSIKSTIAQLNDPVGLSKHICYWNMPFSPIKNSFADLRQLEDNLRLIDEPILIQHSRNDDTIDVDSSYLIFSEVSSDIKDLVIFNKSNHVILSDYDKDVAIDNLISFENKLREQNGK